jgi:hypothetical protein
MKCYKHVALICLTNMPDILDSEQLCCSDIYCFQTSGTVNALEENFQILEMFSSRTLKY